MLKNLMVSLALSIAALALDAQGSRQLVGEIVNPTFQNQRLRLKFVGVQPEAQAKAWVLTGPDDMAFNDPGKEPAVKFTEQPVSGLADALDVAPVSATIFHIRVK